MWLTMETQGWGNWHLKTWKCQISHGLPGPSILGQTIDRYIMKISKRSAGQHCSAYAKHIARLKAMKCMIFFLHFQSILIALEALSSELLFANQFEEIIWNCMDMNCIWTLTSIVRRTAHYLWYPMLIHYHPGYHIAFQYYSHLLSSWKSETSLSSRHITTSKIWSVQLQYIWFRGDIDKYCRDWYSMGTNTTRVNGLSQDHSVWKSM